MKRVMLAGLAALAVGVLFVGTASADPPVLHVVKEPFAFSFVYPAGSLCDFDLGYAFTGTDTVTILSNGYEQVQEKLWVTETNLATGASLSEADSYHLTGNYLDGSSKTAGVFTKLRNADGKLIAVQAGVMEFAPDYSVVKITPKASQDFATLLCPALGGNPAP